MLSEAVGLLYNFVNRVSFQTILNRQRLVLGAPTTRALARRMSRLQEILQEACQGLDPEEPALRRYFGRVALGGEETCLAFLLTESFGAPTGPGLAENMQRIRAAWQEYRNAGAWLKSDAPNTLAFSTEPGQHGDLFTQVCALNLPAELRLQLYGALRDFDGSMAELTALLEPPARRLEALYRKEAWILDETEGYWQEIFERKSPIDYLFAHIDADVLRDVRDDTKIAISLMNCSHIQYWLGGGSDTPEHNFIYIGCGITSASITRKQNDDLETVGAILRTMGDKRRLETLRRLSKERLYLHELAELMGMDPGSMSRTLTTLHNYGFLRQEREALRNYYQTDREMVHSFLELVETVIFE